MSEQETKIKISHIPECADCGEKLYPGEPCYAVQSGYIDEMGDFVRTDAESQLFHIACL